MADEATPQTWEEIIDSGINISTLPDLPHGIRGVSVTASTRVVKGQLKAGQYGRHDIFCDEGPIVGGEDSYPPPMGYFAAAMGF
jgi:hypothetical protein